MRSLTLLALLTATPSTLAQTVSVDSVERDYFLIATGFDFEFDDGVGAQDSNASQGLWQVNPSVTLDDFQGNYIGSAVVQHDSEVTPSRIRTALTGLAEISGSLAFSDAFAETEVAVDFSSPDWQRYRLSIDATTTDEGFAVATIQLSSSAGNTAFVRVFDGDSENLAQVGWLAPNAYAFSALCESSVGNTNSQIASETVITTDLEFFAAGDFNLDGSVDRSDWAAYRLAWQAGDSSADFDGDGDIDGTDISLFEVAVRS